MNYVELTKQDVELQRKLIITMDGPKGEFDNLAVERIIKGQILPYFA